MKTTEAGTALWPMLDEADTKYGLPGNYSVKLKLAPAQAAAMIIEVDKLATERWELARANAADKSALIVLAPPTYKRQPDGSAIFLFRMSAERRGATGNVRQAPGVLDANGKPIFRHCVTTGSTIRVNYASVPYHNALRGVGISLKLISVQLLDAVPEVPAALAA